MIDLFASPSIGPAAVMLGIGWFCIVCGTLWTPGGGGWRVFLRGCLPHFIIPVVMVVVGVFFTVDEDAVAPSYPLYLLQGLFVAHVPLGGYLLWRWRAEWLAVLASTLYAGCLSLAALFIGSMCVTGRWL